MVRNGLMSPCKDCSERHEKCHSERSAYSDYQRKASELRRMEIESRNQNRYYAPWTHAKYMGVRKK